MDFAKNGPKYQAIVFAEGFTMKFLDMLRRFLLWPGTFLTNKLGIDPDSEFGLLRSMFNTLFWTVVGLAITLMIVL